jgi:hypothetical protein
MNRITERPFSDNKKVSLDDIKQAYFICAGFIKKYRHKSEKLLPIFERLGNEIEIYEKQLTLLDKALNVANDNSKFGLQFGIQNGLHFKNRE